MRLNHRNESPPGGFFYVHNGRKITAGTLDRLVVMVGDFMLANDEKVPDDLAWIVEDSICMRIPDSLCRYSRRLGDRISRVIHAVAGAVDKVAGTNLKSRARKCSACAKRRNQLNRAT